MYTYLSKTTFNYHYSNHVIYCTQSERKHIIKQKKRMKLRNGTMPQYFSQLFKGEYFEINTKLISLIKARDISHRS